MKSRWILLWIMISLFGSTLANEFEKIGFWEPYQILKKQTDTTGLGVDSYFGQIDSLGLTGVVGPADAISTNNNFNVAILGADRYLKTGSNTFDNLVHAGHYSPLEVEQNDSLAYYQWDYYHGQNYYENSILIGRFFEAGIDDTGLALSSIGNAWKYSFREIKTMFKMKTWDNTSYDTICNIALIYNGYIFDTTFIGDSIASIDTIGITDTIINSFRGIDFSADRWPTCGPVAHPLPCKGWVPA